MKNGINSHQQHIFNNETLQSSICIIWYVLYLILADIALWIIWISIFKPFPTQCQADNMKNSFKNVNVIHNGQVFTMKMYLNKTSLPLSNEEKLFN